MGAPVGNAACVSGFCGEANVMGLLKVGICGECNSDADCAMGTCSDPIVDLDDGGAGRAGRLRVRVSVV
jgi:hypothetical protein